MAVRVRSHGLGHGNRCSLCFLSSQTGASLRRRLPTEILSWVLMVVLGSMFLSETVVFREMARPWWCGMRMGETGVLLFTQGHINAGLQKHQRSTEDSICVVLSYIVWIGSILLASLHLSLLFPKGLGIDGGIKLKFFWPILVKQ